MKILIKFRLCPSDKETKCYWPPKDVSKRIKSKDFETLNVPMPETNWTLHNVKCTRTEG